MNSKIVGVVLGAAIVLLVCVAVLRNNGTAVRTTRKPSQQVARQSTESPRSAHRNSTVPPAAVNTDSKPVTTAPAVVTDPVWPTSARVDRFVDPTGKWDGFKLDGAQVTSRGLVLVDTASANVESGPVILDKPANAITLLWRVSPPDARVTGAVCLSADGKEWTPWLPVRPMAKDASTSESGLVQCLPVRMGANLYRQVRYKVTLLANDAKSPEIKDVTVRGEDSTGLDVEHRPAPSTSTLWKAHPTAVARTKAPVR